MIATRSRLLSRFVAALAIALLAIQPAAAQSILRDAETEALFRDMAAPLIVAAGLDPKNVDIVLVGDPSINAFVAGGQAVYLNTGLINAADSANEVQGVIAHELGHVTGGHAIGTGGQRRRPASPSSACCWASPPRWRGRATRPWASWRRAARRAGQLSGVQPHPGIDRRCRGRELSFQGRDHRQGLGRVLQEAPEPRIPLWLRQPQPRCAVLFEPPLVGRPHHHADRHLREGPGLDRPPIPSSSAASSWSRPSSMATSPSRS